MSDASRGRTTIAARALNRVASAVTADALGVDARRVGVDLADDHGALALTVSTPIRVVSLLRVEKDESVVARSGGSLIERAGRAQGQIRSQVSDLTGYDVDRVTVRLTAADIRTEERVK